MCALKSHSSILLKKSEMGRVKVELLGISFSPLSETWVGGKEK